MNMDMRSRLNQDAIGWVALPLQSPALVTAQPSSSVSFESKLQRN
jgi:hypothetical protein